MSSDTIKTVEAFIEAINKRDLYRISALVSEDYTFIDASGHVDKHRENIIAGWTKYFQMFPDYRIKVDEIISDETIVAVFGSAFGTYNGKRGLIPENRIGMPAAWKAIVENDKIKLWEVYADWSEGVKIIEEDEKWTCVGSAEIYPT